MTAAVVALCLLLAAQAATPQETPAGPPAPLVLAPARWVPPEKGAAAAGGQRVALLVGVGTYARHPLWNLGFVKGDLDLLATALVEKAGFHAVERVVDGEATLDGLKTKLGQLEARLGGEDNLVVLYWVGHGFVDGTGELRLFLHHTDERAAAGGIEYTSTLGETDLAAALEPLRRSRRTRTVVVADACRVNVLAPAPDRRPREVKLADAVIYSTGRGRFAVPAEGQGHSAFAESFSGALEGLSARPFATVKELFEATRTAMEAIPGLTQRPELVTSEDTAGDVRVFDRANLTLGVRAVDGLTRTELKGVVVKLLEKRAESPATFRGLAEGSYRVEAARDGYIPVVEPLDLDVARSGGVLELTLFPALEFLDGAVRDATGKALEGLDVRLEGGRAGFLRGYHNYEARTDREGRYRFAMPPGARVTAVRVEAGKSSRSLPVDLQAARPREELVGPWLRRTFDVGTLVLPSGTVVEVAKLGLKGRDAITWREAEEFIKAGQTENLDVAASYLLAVLPKVDKSKQEAVRARIAEVYRELLAHLVARGRYREGASKAAEALKAFPGDGTFEETRLLCERENIPAELRTLLVEAASAAGKGDLEQAEGLYRRVDKSEERLTPYYRERVGENLAAVVEQLFLNALSRIGASWRAGETAKAVAAYNEAKRLDPTFVPLAAWEEKLSGHTAEVSTEQVISAGGPEFTNLAKNTHGYPEYRHDVTGIIFVALPGGKFSMGSPDSEAGHEPDEGPVHEVELSPFLIAKYEVTQAQWQKVMGSNPSYFKNAGADAPVENVSREDCQEFCRKTGLRLPSEAQWEYACRGGSTTAIYTGALRIVGQRNGPDLDPIAWYGGNSGVSYQGGYDSSGWPEKQLSHTSAGTHPVGKKSPNAFGLHDMLGNVWEWCEDVYDSSFYGKAEARRKDPVSTSGSVDRVYRGGCWFTYAQNCRSANRFRFAPGTRSNDVGFRPALLLP